MAIAGSMTSAYEIHMERGAMVMYPTTYPKDRCLSPAEAVARLAAGFPVIVAGADTLAFRKLWEQERESASENAG